MTKFKYMNPDSQEWQQVAPTKTEYDAFTQKLEIINGDPNGIFIGHSDFSFAPFSVSPSGAFTATNATITGVMTLAAGSGGIYGGNLAIGSGNNIIKTDVNGFYAGNAVYSSAPTRISPAGQLRALNAEISGAITAGAGSSIPWEYILDAPVLDELELPSYIKEDHLDFTEILGALGILGGSMRIGNQLISEGLTDVLILNDNGLQIGYAGSVDLDLNAPFHVSISGEMFTHRATVGGVLFDPVQNAGAYVTTYGADPNTGQIRNIYISNLDPEPGVGKDGDIWFKYEEPV